MRDKYISASPKKQVVQIQNFEDADNIDEDVIFYKTSSIPRKKKKNYEIMYLKPQTSQDVFRYTATNRYGATLPTKKLNKYSKSVYNLGKYRQVPKF